MNWRRRSWRTAKKRLMEMDNGKIVVLFSGGTDSLLTSALMAEKFREVHLLTYHRFGFFATTNSELNVRKLKEKYGDTKFTHSIIKTDKLTKYVFNERYLRNLLKHGFFMLSNCGLCKLAMHIRTVIFCLDNNIRNVCDGANRNMRLFPDQMRNVLEEYRKMYARFGINHMSPVFELEYPQGLDYADRLHLDRVLPAEGEKDDPDAEKRKRTAGYKLCEMGLMPSENVKGTELDRKMQPRCFQFILSNIFINGYYLQDHTYEEYERETVKFQKEKIDFFIKLLDEYAEKGKKSRIAKLIED